MRGWLVLATAIALDLCACSLAFPTHESSNALPNEEAGTSDGSSSSSSSSSSGSSGTSSSSSGNVPVPGTVEGATFNRGNDAANPATVTTFKLDVEEVTVARFRAFVAGFDAKRPKSGDGKNPHLPADPGWDNEANGRLAGTGSDLASRLTGGCLNGNTTWTASAGANENLPMTCVTWTEAFAFCIFDGGRLPTEAEWNLAAAGGAEQRAYPWPDAEPNDDDHAVFEGGVLAVGSKPKGAGRFGQLDLAGNVAEWVRDAAGDYPKPCQDCAKLDAASQRVVRGGSFASGKAGVTSASRVFEDPEHRVATIGLRCAR